MLLEPNPHKPLPEKRKREAFKKLVADIIGVSKGQKHIVFVTTIFHKNIFVDFQANFR